MASSDQDFHFALEEGSQWWNTNDTASSWEELISAVESCGDVDIATTLTRQLDIKDEDTAYQCEAMKKIEVLDTEDINADELDAQFSLLVNDVALSFSARKVNIHDMKKYLRYLPVFREHTHASNRVPGFLYLIRKDLISCDTIPELFKCLSIYWSWFNYILFEKLVKKFSNWGDKDFSAVGNYKLKLNKFLKRKVSEMPTHTHCTNKIFGFKQHIKTCSGENVNQEANHILMIRDRLATSLGIEIYALILTEINDGGVELVFLVPAQEAAKDIIRELHSEPSDFHRYQPAIPVLDQPTIPVLDLDQPTIPVLEQSTVPLDQPTIPVLDLDRPTIPVLEQSTVSMLVYAHY